MDINAAFPSVAKGLLVKLMMVRQIEGDLIQWTESFLSERMMEMIIQRNATERHPVEAAVRQGSPAAPIIFAIYTSGLSKWVEQYVLEGESLSFVHKLGWEPTGSDVNHVITIPARCAAKRIQWASRPGLQFDTANTQAAQFTRR